MTKKKGNKFPKVLYIRRYTDGDEVFFVVEKDPEKAAIFGEVVDAGVYRLDRIVKVSTRVDVEDQ